MKRHVTLILALIFFVSVMMEPVAAVTTDEAMDEGGERTLSLTSREDADETAENAIAIELGETVSDTCPAEGTVYYKFKTGSTETRYHVILQNKGAGSLYFELHNADNTEVYRNDYTEVSGGETESSDYLGLAPNTWYIIEVTNNNYSAVTFSLTVNNHFGNAKALAFGEKVKTDQWVKFKSLSNPSLYIFSNETWYELWNKNGTGSWTTSADKYGHTCYGEEILSLPTNTWFTKEMKAGRSVQDTYSISTTLKLGTKKTSQKCPSGKVVWYKFKTTSNNSHYRVTLNNGSGGEATIKVYDAYIKAGQVENRESSYIYKYAHISSHSKDSVLIKPTRNSWCYVRVEAPDSTAKYSIIVEEEKDNGGDTFAAAKKIGQTTQKGYFNGGSDDDWFKFTAPISGNYTLTLTRPSADDLPFVQVYNRDEKEIDGWETGWEYDYEEYHGYAYSFRGYSRSVTLKGLKKGETIWLKVYNEDDYYAPNSHYTLTVKYRTTPTSVSSLSSSATSIKVNWKKRSNVSGYQIKCSSSKAFSASKTKTVTVKGKTKSAKAITKLNRRTKYYVKVRSYRVIDGKKYYSTWSKVKAIWTK